MRFACVLGVLCSFSATSWAQWLNYPTPGVPKTNNGVPDLSAPPPRTPEGTPDLSGIWYSAETMPPPCPESSCITQPPLPADQVDIARHLPGGLPYRAWAAQLVKQRAARGGRDDPHARCMPPNYPRAYSLPQNTKIVQTPKLIVMLHEFNATYRQIFMDGRPLPLDPNPSWNGYSIAHWDGDTLVIETLGFRDDLWLDRKGNPLTESARTTERLTRVNFGTLRVQVTVNDPKAYTRPWTVTLDQRIVLNTEMLDEICMDNEQSQKLLNNVK